MFGFTKESKNMQNYNVQKVTTKTGIFFTARTDDRSGAELLTLATWCVANDNANTPFHQAVAAGGVAPQVDTIWEGLSKKEAFAKRDSLIEYERALGVSVVLNTKYVKGDRVTA